MLDVVVCPSLFHVNFLQAYSLYPYVSSGLFPVSVRLLLVPIVEVVLLHYVSAPKPNSLSSSTDFPDADGSVATDVSSGTCSAAGVATTSVSASTVA
jgi:hypothetical protein